MANRYATKAGVWSDVTVWDGGTTLPAPADVVRANGFIVTIDQNINVGALSTKTGSGSFLVSTIGVGVTRTIQLSAGFASDTHSDGGLWLNITAPDGTLDMSSFTMIGRGASNGGHITINGACTVKFGDVQSTAYEPETFIDVAAAATIFTGTIRAFSPSNGNGCCFKLRAAVTMTVNGSLLGGATSNYDNGLITVSSAGVNLHITGNVDSTNANGGTVHTGSCLRIYAPCTVVIDGFVKATSQTNNNHGIAVTGAAGTYTITVGGDVTGATASNAYGIIFNANNIVVNCTINGKVIAGSGVGLGLVNQANGSTVTILNGVTGGASQPGVYVPSPYLPTLVIGGDIESGANGYVPVWAQKWLAKNNLITSWKVLTDTASFNTLRLGVGDAPNTADVRNGVAYGGGLTGTLKVPAASSVAAGVAVGAGVGTAALKLADVAQVVGAQLVGAVGAYGVATGNGITLVPDSAGDLLLGSV